MSSSGIPGGIPFGMPGGIPKDDVDTDKLYETLEVDKDASEKDIKKAYRRLSRIHHPDKGGEEEAFKAINAAYEILSDNDKRKAYDKYGLDGVTDDGGRSQSGDDLFSMFFGGKSGRQGGPKKGPDIKHPLKVSLEDLYNGKTKKMAINRKVIDGEVKTCEKCNGAGYFFEPTQLGPGMFTQVQRPCPECHGDGATAKTKKERKIVELHIEKGMPNHKRIVFQGMADEVPGAETGNVVFILQEEPHDVFHRKGADLLVDKTLSLNQALCGFTWKLTHLDGHEIIIKNKPGQVIKAQMVDERSGQTLPYIQMIRDEGMPSYGNPFVKGNLYIKFVVNFPNDNTFSEDDLQTLKSILPNPDVPPTIDESKKDENAMDVEGDAAAAEPEDAVEPEEVTMEDADLYNFGKGGAAASSESAYDSDGGGEGNPVQCQQS